MRTPAKQDPQLLKAARPGALGFRSYEDCFRPMHMESEAELQYLPGCLGRWVQGGGVQGNLREPWGVLGKIGEYWGLLGYLPPLNYPA